VKLLVTGGAGFIGSHLIERLLIGGSGVRVLDNLSTGKRANLPAHGAIEFMEGDIRDRQTVDAAVAGVDVIVHLAAVASVQASVDDPVGTHAANFDGTLNLLESARRTGVARFLYASSAAVYGDNARLPVNEDLALNPLTPYATDKLAGEYYLGFYHRKFGLRTTAFRFFNIYGPRQDPSSPYSGVISIFVDRLRASAPVTIFGDGRQTRDFVFVGDLADLLARAIEAPATVGKVMNVGCGVECSLLELLATLERLSGRRLECRHEAARVGDILRSCADTSRLTSLLGSAPGTSMEAGLAELLRYSGIALAA
jgi:UDP-glucose 4-epimerase